MPTLAVRAGRRLRGEGDALLDQLAGDRPLEVEPFADGARAQSSSGLKSRVTRRRYAGPWTGRSGDEREGGRVADRTAAARSSGSTHSRRRADPRRTSALSPALATWVDQPGCKSGAVTTGSESPRISSSARRARGRDVFSGQAGRTGCDPSWPARRSRSRSGRGAAHRARCGATTTEVPHGGTGLRNRPSHCIGSCGFSVTSTSYPFVKFFTSATTSQRHPGPALSLRGAQRCPTPRA